MRIYIYIVLMKLSFKIKILSYVDVNVTLNLIERRKNSVRPIIRNIVSDKYNRKLEPIEVR